MIDPTCEDGAPNTGSPYRISITCDHGDRKPRVAVASYSSTIQIGEWNHDTLQYEGDAESDGARWSIRAQRARDYKGSRSVNDPPQTPRPSQLPARQKAMYRGVGDARRPGSGNEDDATRQFINCTICGARPLGRWPNVVRALDQLRHADIHSVTLQQLALML